MSIYELTQYSAEAEGCVEKHLKAGRQLSEVVWVHHDLFCSQLQLRSCIIIGKEPHPTN
jgi:hypothetical protein